MKNSTKTVQRIGYIDALRGVAVLLMIEQHLGYWLWNSPPGSIHFFDHPFLLSFNALGGFAAPVFVTLAGVGVSLFSLRHSNVDVILVRRGFIIMIFGYILNAITPSWFSLGSWYVLHMIGFAIILFPLFRRLNSSVIFFIGIIVVVSTVVLQNLLDTPSFLSSERMRSLDLRGGFLRLALVEGQFPIFPWLYFFLTGILTGRWIVDKKISRIVCTAVITFFLGAILSIFYFMQFDFAVAGPFHRFFRLGLGFYPALPPIVFLLSSLVLFALIIFYFFEERHAFSSRNLLVCLGRTSLTLLMVHVFFFREISHHLDYWQIFSTVETLLIILGVWVLAALLSVIWQKYGYRYGLEWLLRRISD
jgi:uncharacterized membrane protein